MIDHGRQPVEAAARQCQQLGHQRLLLAGLSEPSAVRDARAPGQAAHTPAHPHPGGQHAGVRHPAQLPGGHRRGAGGRLLVQLRALDGHGGRSGPKVVLAARQSPPDPS